MTGFVGSAVGGFFAKIITFVIGIFWIRRGAAEEQARKDEQAQVDAAKIRADAENRAGGESDSQLRDELRRNGSN